MRANIHNKTIRLWLQKDKVRKKDTNAKKEALKEWIKSTSYEKLKSGNSISKSRWCNTLITVVPLLRQILILPDVSHKYLIHPDFFNSLYIPNSSLLYPHKLALTLGTPWKS